MAKPLTEAPRLLRVLADWFDAQDRARASSDHGVQEDLRAWANEIECQYGLLRRSLGSGQRPVPLLATTLDEYQYESDAFDFACPTKGVLWFYALGLCGEAGEVGEKIKKHYRDAVPLDKDAVALELGDVLWYVAQVARLVGFSLQEVARLNVEKLQARAARDALRGSGDKR